MECDATTAELEAAIVPVQDTVNAACAFFAIIIVGCGARRRVDGPLAGIQPFNLSHARCAAQLCHPRQPRGVGGSIISGGQSGGQCGAAGGHVSPHGDAGPGGPPVGGRHIGGGRQGRHLAAGRVGRVPHGHDARQPVRCAPRRTVARAGRDPGPRQRGDGRHRLHVCHLQQRHRVRAPHL